MNENIHPDSDFSGEELEELRFKPPLEAVWHSPDGDVQIKVTGTFDGHSMYSVEGKRGGVRGDEVDILTSFPSQFSEADSSSEGQDEELAQEIGEVAVEPVIEQSEQGAQEQYKEGDLLTLNLKGDIQNDWVTDKQDGRHGDFVKVKKENGTKAGTYAPPHIVSRRKADKTQEKAPTSENKTSQEPESKKPELEINVGMEVVQRDGGRLFTIAAITSSTWGSRPREMVQLYSYKDDGTVDGNAAMSVESLRERLSRENGPWRLPTQEDLKRLGKVKDNKKEPDKKSGNGGKDKPPDNKANKDKNGENPWLDPRFILQIKEKYQASLEQHERIARGLDDDVSKHFKTILKNQAIERAVRDRLDRDKWLAGKGITGEKRQAGFQPMAEHDLEEPSKEIKEQIFTLLDNGDLNRLASETELQEGRDFKVGKVVDHNGEKWTISSFQRLPHGRKVLLTQEDGKTTGVMERDLRSEQAGSRGNRTQEEIDLDRLRPFLKSAVRVKLPSGEVVEGRVGYSTTKNKAVVFGEGGKLLREGVNVNEFVQWQYLKTTDEELDPYLGKDIRIINSNGEVEIGQIEYSKEGHRVKFTNNEGAESEFNADDFIRSQKIVTAKLERIDREVLEGERKFTLGQKITKLRGRALPNEMIVHDFYKNGDEIIVQLFDLSTNRTLEMEQDLLLEISSDDYVDPSTQQTTANIPPPDPNATGNNPPANPTPLSTPNQPQTNPNAPAPADARKAPPALSWWEQTKGWWDNLPSNKAKVSSAVGGLLLANSLVVAIPGYVIQHRIHKKRLERYKAGKDPVREVAWEWAKYKWQESEFGSNVNQVVVLGASALLFAGEGAYTAGETLIREFKDIKKHGKKIAQQSMKVYEQLKRVDDQAAEELRDKTRNDERMLIEMSRRLRGF
jgi:hypothetical protein